MIGGGTGGFTNNGTRGEYSNNNIIKIGRNTVQNPGDLRGFVVTQTPVKDHHR